MLVGPQFINKYYGWLYRRNNAVYLSNEYPFKGLTIHIMPQWARSTHIV